MVELQIDIKIELAETTLKQQEPDGSKCEFCGEFIFLQQFQARFVFVINDGKRTFENYPVCSACADALKSKLKLP